MQYMYVCMYVVWLLLPPPILKGLLYPHFISVWYTIYETSLMNQTYTLFQMLITDGIRWQMRLV